MVGARLRPRRVNVEAPAGPGDQDQRLGADGRRMDRGHRHLRQRTGAGRKVEPAAAHRLGDDELHHANDGGQRAHDRAGAGERTGRARGGSPRAVDGAEDGA